MSYLHKTYKRFKNNVGISKYLYESCKGFTKLWKLHKSYVRFTSYLHKSYNRFKNNVGISKDLYESCKGFTKLWKLHKSYVRFTSYLHNINIIKDLRIM